MGPITVTNRSDESVSDLEKRTRSFDVEIEDFKDADGSVSTLCTTASITYGRYTDIDESVFNRRDISVDDGDIDILDLVVSEISKQLLAEGFGETTQRFT
jgi:hypothetical protein